mmetsp:Transcript_70561/g.188325  ORF Transcript_70561/g.188325 Transcript_70561/m.188325 type:complete len:231 (-) Transcript_70561:427-1119(-)
MCPFHDLLRRFWFGVNVMRIILILVLALLRLRLAPAQTTVHHHRFIRLGCDRAYALDVRHALIRERGIFLLTIPAPAARAREHVGLPRHRSLHRRTRGSALVLVHSLVDHVVEVLQLRPNQVLEHRELLHIQAAAAYALPLFGAELLPANVGGGARTALAGKALGLLLGQLQPGSDARRILRPKLTALHLGDPLHDLRHGEALHALALVPVKLPALLQKLLHGRVGLWRR